MKKILIFLLFLIPATLSPYGYDYVIIEMHEGYNPYERIWEAWAAVCMIESSNNANAHNISEDSRGIAQIRAIKVADYNRLTGSNIQHDDCFDIEISRMIFFHHCKQYDDIWEAVRRWNGDGKLSFEYVDKIKKTIDKKLAL